MYPLSFVQVFYPHQYNMKILTDFFVSNFPHHLESTKVFARPSPQRKIFCSRQLLGFVFLHGLQTLKVEKLSRMLHLFSRAAIIKYCTLSGLNNGNLSPTVPEVRSPGLRCQQVWFFPRPLSLACRPLPSCCVLTGSVFLWE